MSDLYIGLMSGTSLDGLDVAIVDFEQQLPALHACASRPIPDDLRAGLLDLCHGRNDSLGRVAEMDVCFGRWCAKMINELLKSHRLDRHDIHAIGHHGQTIRHCPDHDPPYTVQIGDPNTIAELTGITTIADFRRGDIAAGGQGAPLVPAFHEILFRSASTDRVIVNIGGIANLTILPADISKPVTGFDCGPGNVLLDLWVHQQLGKTRDEKGDWAASGAVSDTLLAALLRDDFFNRAPPKSSGREYFNLSWLERYPVAGLAPQDVQASLCRLTAETIVDATNAHAPQPSEIIACGGGVHNLALMDALRHLYQAGSVRSSAEYGVPPDWIEAMAFAWLARQTLHGKAGNLPSVTGARHPLVLGGIYTA